MTLSDLGVVWETGRNLSWEQLLSRAGRRARYRCLYPWAAAALFPPPAPDSLGAPAKADGGRDALPGGDPRALREGRFQFLNLPPRELGSPSRWDDAPDGDRLWLYTLHYGEWAVDLARAFRTEADPAYRDALLRLLNDWLDANPVGSEPGWEPYPLSRRLTAWSRLPGMLAGDAAWSRFWTGRLAPSLFQQAGVLASNLELDLANNHLLANYGALARIGLLFPDWPGAAERARQGLEGLWGEMRRQVLGDGAHDERSVSYHAIVLRDLLDAWGLARDRGLAPPADVAATLEKMLDFLAQTRLPGGWPMVNDSVPGYPEDLDALSASAADLLGVPVPGRRPAAAFPEAGYVALDDGPGGALFFDAGPMGPARMPGHGHADALSFELHAGGAARIVDPGVFTYRAGPWRDHFRGTRAHNTVAVDGRDQAPLWGAFRVGRQPRARLLRWSERSVEGEHDGYTRLTRPVLHRRVLERLEAGVWECRDALEGSGEHDYELGLQLAPGARGSLSAAAAEFRWDDGGRLAIVPSSAPPGARAAIEDGWVSPGWNLKTQAPRYALRWRGAGYCETRLRLEARSA